MTDTVHILPCCCLITMARQAHKLGRVLVGRNGRVVMGQPRPGEPVLLTAPMMRGRGHV